MLYSERLLLLDTIAIVMTVCMSHVYVYIVLDKLYWECCMR